MKAKFDSNIVFVFHATYFPNPVIPNLPESFGIHKANVKTGEMSFGRLHAFPREVWASVFGEWKKSPLFKLQQIRTRLQTFMDQKTFTYFAGAIKGMPVGNLPVFLEIVSVIKSEFEEEKVRYLKHLDDLVEKANFYWKSRVDDVFPNNSVFAMDFIQKKLEIYRDPEWYDGKFKLEITPLKVESLDDPSTALSSEEAKAYAAEKAAIAKQSIEQLRQKNKEFQEQMVIELRQKVFAAWDELNGKLQGKAFNQKSINACKKIMSEFDTMNIMNDSQLQEFIDNNLANLSKQEAKLLKASDSKMLDFAEYVAAKTEELAELKEKDVSSVINAFIGNETRVISTEEIIEKGKDGEDPIDPAVADEIIGTDIEDMPDLF